MKTNQAGINLIKSFEGLKLEAYKCPAGIPTIGYGTTGKDIVMGLKWTKEQAEARLKADVAKFETGVAAVIKVALNSNQFSALVCFAYNVGVYALTNSTLLKKVNAKDFAGASLEFSKWNKANGKVLNGLTRRRAAEKELFLKPEVQSTMLASQPKPVAPCCACSKCTCACHKK